MGKSFRVLAIDGGGALGLYPAIILQQIEEHILNGEPIQSHFDLITGTSTGGLIALSLSAGNSPEEIGQLYEERAKIIFPNNVLLPLRFINCVIGRSIYSNKPLSAVLENHFGNMTMADLKIPVCIASVDTVTCTPIVFKTKNSEHLTRDLNYRLVDIAVATSAAPVFFPTYGFETFESLIDGGVWQNNPSMIGLIEANAYFLRDGKSYDRVELLSIGNPLSNERSGYSRKCHFSSICSWNLKLVTLPMKVSSNGIHYQMKILDQTNCMNLAKYLRIATDNRPKTKKRLALNSSGRKALEIVRNQAFHDFNHFKNELISFFVREERV